MSKLLYPPRSNLPTQIRSSGCPGPRSSSYALCTSRYAGSSTRLQTARFPSWYGFRAPSWLWRSSSRVSSFSPYFPASSYLSFGYQVPATSVIISNFCNLGVHFLVCFLCEKEGIIDPIYAPKRRRRLWSVSLFNQDKLRH